MRDRKKKKKKKGKREENIKNTNKHKNRGKETTKIPKDTIQLHKLIEIIAK